MNVSLFKTIVSPYDVKHPHYAPVLSVLNAIKDGRWKQMVDEVRSKTSKDERGKVKEKMPAVLFAGKFSERRIDAFEESSGLVCIDFDGLSENGIADIEKILESKPWVYAYFVSPSGKGVKALVRANFNTYEEYKSVFCAIDSDLGQLESFDMLNSDISRACFVSYDPDIYINEDAEVFDQYVENWELYLKNRRLSSPEEIFKLLLKWMDKNGYAYQKGQRNNYLYVLASALCRYGVQENETEGFFIQKFDDLDVREIQTVINSAYKRNDFGSVRITDVHPSQEASYYRGLEVPDFDFDPRSVLTNTEEVNQKVMDIAHSKTNYQSFGLPEMDKYFVLKTNELYAFVAGAKAGKTLLINYLALMAAKYAGWKFLVLTTEAEIEEFKATMVSFLCDNHIRRCNDDKIAEALYAIDQSFTFIENNLDHLQIFDVYHYQKTQGIDYDCIIVDPITNIKKSKKIQGRGNEYFEDLYVEYLKFARQYCSVWVINHTVTSKEREQTAPYVQDGEYGVHLFRRCHYGITLYRNVYDEIEKNKVECHIRAVRTALNRGGGVTTNNNPIEFHFVVDPIHFGYDIVVDGHRFKNPLIHQRAPDIEVPPSHYETEDKEELYNDTEGFKVDDNTDEEIPF